MANHCGPDLGIDGVAQNRYEKENAEKEYVEGEYDNGYPVEPYSVVGQIVEEYRDNPSPHYHGKPSYRSYI